MFIIKLLQRIFVVNWSRKVVAFFAALILWYSVNQSLITTATFPSVPIKVINLPKGKTIVGLQDGILQKRLAISVTGKKTLLSELNPQNLELVINAEGQSGGWIPKIDKSNLVSLSSNVDLKAINSVQSHEIFLQITDLVTDEILVTITDPIGDPPRGYQFLGVWPQYVRQKITASIEEIERLKEHGLTLTFNLDRISQEELDQLSKMSMDADSEEISFYVPRAWKEVVIDAKTNQTQTLNDPAAKYLRIIFLKQELISLGLELPISIFFPVQYSHMINPENYSLATNEIVQRKNGLKILTLPLYVQDVSRLFLDVVRNNLLLTVLAAPPNVQPYLNWTLECIDPSALEDAFVQASLHEAKQREDRQLSLTNEAYLRDRFRHYLRQLKLYRAKDQPLNIEATLEENKIVIKEIK